MTGTDSRRRGMAVRSLYLYGYKRTGTGIYNAGSGGGGHMDWCAFEWNMIHNFANGIDVYADTPQDSLTTRFRIVPVMASRQLALSA